jgi:gamma-glutamyltranspeptidase/glutathione hydrolase
VKTNKANSGGDENSYQSRISRCAIETGSIGAVSTAHPLATASALHVLTLGGSAVDAAIAAQAVTCVVMPHAAGIGGDMLALVYEGAEVTAVNGVGRSPISSPATWGTQGGAAVTVPGLSPSWFQLHKKWGRVPLPVILDAAINLADQGFAVDPDLLAAVTKQRPRLVSNGAGQWSLLSCAIGEKWRQPTLAELLTIIASDASGDAYTEAIAHPISSAVQQRGGSLSVEDIWTHQTVFDRPIRTSWGLQTLWVQPPSSQGVLLAMAASWLEGRDHLGTSPSEHLLAELTDAVFCHRDEVSLGEQLLKRELDVDPERASNRGGARAYLHTAGVAVADSSGMVVSSLISVFDDFGSAIYVPEGGFILNNRAAGFTNGLNAARPHSFPVHTLAPAILTGPDNSATAIATPGADGQIQTLLQVMVRLRYGGSSVPEAIAAPRWRSQGRHLLVEDDHPALSHLTTTGHRVVPTAAGDDVFGAVVTAGFHGAPWAAGDWRRNVSTGASG